MWSDQLILFYKAFVSSIMAYRVILFGNATAPTLIRLERVQNLAIRLVLGAIKFTPIPALQFESTISPLSFRRIKRPRQYLSIQPTLPCRNLGSLISELSLGIPLCRSALSEVSPQSITRESDTQPFFVRVQSTFYLSLIHIWRCRRSTLCRSRWSPYH